MPDSKQNIKMHEEIRSVLNDIPAHISIMAKAIQLQSKAAQFGFDWPTIQPVFEKLQEEIQELKHEIELSTKGGETVNAHNQHRLQDELGDVLFCCMNLARFLNLNPEKALQSTNDKFERRFSFIESYVFKQGKKMKDLSLEELDNAWDLAKEKGL